MKGVKNDLQVPGLRIRWWWDVLRKWWGRKKVWWESFEYCPYTGVFNGFIWVVDASVRIALTMCMTPHYDMFIACVLRERCRLPIYVKKIGNWNDLYNSVLQFLNVCEYLNVDWASLVAQQVKNHLQCGRRGFDPWVGKIPWRQKRLPSPVFWPGEFHGLYSPWGRKESDRTEWLSLHPSALSSDIQKGIKCKALLPRPVVRHRLILQEQHIAIHSGVAFVPTVLHTIKN